VHAKNFTGGKMSTESAKTVERSIGWTGVEGGKNSHRQEI